MTDLSQKFKGKYRIESNRLKGWDYGAPGYYFVTICSKNREPWFGEVRGEHMLLSPVGEIAEMELEKTPQIRPQIDLATWVVMPNHVHAIITIKTETPQRSVSSVMNWRSGTLGAIINQYKSSCTKRIRALGYPEFAWQSGYYDHIIRHEEVLKRIYDYIAGNPARWREDDYFRASDPG
jgi:REP element-mobilizing transposase RayT